MGPRPLLGKEGWRGEQSHNCENLRQKNVGMVVARKWLGVRGMFAPVLGNFGIVTWFSTQFLAQFS